MIPLPHRHRPMTLATSLAAVLIVVGLGAVAGVASAGAPAQAPLATSCTSVTTVGAASRLALVGDPFVLTTTVASRCAGSAFPLHIALVLDGSRSMAGEATEALKRRARKLVDQLDLTTNPTTSIAVIEINQPSKRLCALTNNVSQLSTCIDRLAADGGSDIAGAILLGIEAIGAGRNMVDDRDTTREVLIVLADGGNGGGCGPVLANAGQAKGQGILVATGCVTAGCDSDCMRSTATSPRYFFASGELDVLSSVLVTIRKQFQSTIVKHVALTETLGSAFDVVAGSAQPEPRASDGRQVEWWLTPDPLPLDAVTLTLGVRPVASGLGLPVLAGAVGRLTDNKNRPGDLTFVLPRMDVLDARGGAPLSPMTATVPVSNRLAVRSARLVVGQPMRVTYHLELPDGDAARLNTAVVHLRAPDHLRVRAAWRNGRPDGQADADGHGAQWMVVGTAADVLDLEAEVEATGPGGGGLGVVVYRWEVDSRKPAVPVVAAVSAPVAVDAAQSPGPTPTAVPRSFRLLLPVALAEPCLTAQPSDVVAVVDTSLSMGEPLPGGGRKFEAAATALEALVGRLDEASDRIALVTFDGSAVVRRPLGQVGSGVVDALRRAPLGAGTAIGAGLLSAGAVLASPDHRPGARGVVILLTDGRSSTGTPAAAIAAADALRAADATVFAVGLGPEVDRALLGGIAGGPGEVWTVADAGSLAAAFGSIGGRLACPGTGRWGGRAK